MTIPVSTVPAVMKYLQSEIITQIADTTVLVTYGPPGTNQPRDIVAVMGFEARDVKPQAFVGSGAQHWLYESYEIEVIVSVFRGGATDIAESCFERAMTLLSAVETAVRNDPSLGNNVLEAYPQHVAKSDAFWDPEHKGFVVEMSLLIHCEAEI